MAGVKGAKKSSGSKSKRVTLKQKYKMMKKVRQRESALERENGIIRWKWYRHRRGLKNTER